MALLKGTLDVLVLKTVSWQPMHAGEVAAWLEDRSNQRFVIEDAALMQALHRLETRKLLSAEWGITDKGRRARYYCLTSAGRAYLRDETVRLTDYVDALTSILTRQRADA